MYATDGASPPNKDLEINFKGPVLLGDTGWTQPGTTNYDSVNSRLSNIRITSRAGDKETRKINIRQDSQSAVAPILLNYADALF